MVWYNNVQYHVRTIHQRMGRPYRWGVQWSCVGSRVSLLNWTNILEKNNPMLVCLGLKRIVIFSIRIFFSDN